MIRELTTKTNFLFVSIVVGMLVSGCQNTGTPEAGKKDAPAAVLGKSTDSTGSDQSNKMLAPTEDGIPYLYFTEDEFRQFEKGNGRKLKFEFCVNGKNQFLDLIVYQFKNNRYVGNPQLMHNDLGFIALMLDPSKVNVFGGQKLAKDDIAAIFKALDANASSNQYVLFEPQRDLQSFHLYFNVYVVDTLPQELGAKALTPLGRIATTNPSPPATEDPNSRL